MTTRTMRLARRPGGPASLFVCIVQLAGLGGILGLAPGAQARDPEPNQLQVRIADDLMTVEAHDVPLHAVLDEVVRHSDLIVASYESLDELATVKLHRLPLPDAISAILADRSFLLEYTPGARPPGEQHAPNRLWIFSADQGPGRDPSVTKLLHAESSAMRALSHTEARVRIEAIGRLADAGGERAAAALATLALRDSDASVRREAIYAYGEVSGVPDRRVLNQALADPDNRVRRAAIEVCAELGGDDAASALSIALSDPDVALREAAVNTLGDVGGAVAVELLQQASMDRESIVRAAATEMLAELDGVR